MHDMKNSKIPKFDAYVCVGDCVHWQHEGFDLTATVVHDHSTHIDDFDCYSAVKIKQWKNDEWFFCGIIISVEKNDVLLSDHAASLWGIDCNYNKTSNKHLSEVCAELQDEAIKTAKTEEKRIIKALTGDKT